MFIFRSLYSSHFDYRPHYLLQKRLHAFKKKTIFYRLGEKNSASIESQQNIINFQNFLAYLPPFRGTLHYRLIYTLKDLKLTNKFIIFSLLFKPVKIWEYPFLMNHNINNYTTWCFKLLHHRLSLISLKIDLKFDNSYHILM